MANNADWLTQLNYIDFLRDVGRHFSVNRMLSFDSVKMRLDREQELSFLEFNYMILQAYDFVELNKRNGCVLQMGGSDQWGNIVNGIDLGRRMVERAALRADLAADHHSVRRQDGQDRRRRGLAQRRPGEPYDYWQYWRNTEDADVGALPQAVHRAAARRDRAGSRRCDGAEINEAKKVLATEATALVHGRAAADAAAETARTHLRGGRARREPADGRNRRARKWPASACSRRSCKAGLVASNGEARRQIKGGGLRVNDDDRHRREDGADTGDSDAGRRRQAVARQEAPRAAEADLDLANGRLGEGAVMVRRLAEFEELAQHAGRDRRDRIDHGARIAGALRSPRR